VKPFWPFALRVAIAALGILFVLMSTLLYPTEEGLIQNKLEEWWIALDDAEPRAVGKHTAFMAGVANITTRLFDRLFGDNLLSAKSVAVSACFSLASLGFVCSPGLTIFEGQYPDLIQPLYVPVIVLLVVVGMLPAALGPRLSERRSLAGVLGLCFLSLLCMHSVDWFDAHRRVGREFLYNAVFLLVTIGSDAIFITATRWLLRKVSSFRSVLKILGTMVANILLAGLLVLLPAFVAWREIRGRVGPPDEPGVRNLIVWYTWDSNAREIFLTTLAGSNALDALVASTFFILLLLLLIHRSVWPAVKRPTYALASRGIIQRRGFFFILGLILVGAGGVSSSAIAVLKKVLQSFVT
jgi:hypothetical protein